MNNLKQELPNLHNIPIKLEIINKIHWGYYGFTYWFLPQPLPENKPIQITGYNTAGELTIDLVYINTA